MSVHALSRGLHDRVVVVVVVVVRLLHTVKLSAAAGDSPRSEHNETVHIELNHGMACLVGHSVMHAVPH